MIILQTFIVSYDPAETARILDRQRLGKQRVEAIQIARINLGLQESNAWKNHPIVKMWKNYLPYLIKKYIPAIFYEWEWVRNYNNTKSYGNWVSLYNIVIHDEIIFPSWITDELILSHKSNLLRKNPSYYKDFFPNVPENLPYVWKI